jgi:hypothetical protein
MADKDESDLVMVSNESKEVVKDLIGTGYWFEIEIKDFFEYHKYFIRQSGDRN